MSPRPYQASKSCLWGTSRKLPVINSSSLLHTKLPSSVCSISDNHSGACHNVLLSFSQASHLVQGITTSKGQFLKNVKDPKNLIFHLKFGMSPLHHQASKLPDDEAPVLTSRPVRRPSINQPDQTSCRNLAGTT